MAKPVIEALLKKLPHSPGVYKMKDGEGRILYVGKAKDLSKRVHSYFRVMKNRPMRTQKLVENIENLEWIEVSSDLEALFLETNLIKEFRPKYNVLMKDDKNFVYIKITKEDFPRILVVRRVDKDGARYFGPKTAAHTVRKTLTLLQKLFMYRSCDLDLEWKNGETVVTKKTIAYPCLDYHIKRCAAPCISKISAEEYAQSIRKIELFLDGKTVEIETELKEQMAIAVSEKKFEKAAQLRDKLLSLQNLNESADQLVTSPDQYSMDVFAFVLEAGKAYFNLFILRNGKLVNQENFIVDAFGYEAGEEEQATDVMEAFLTQYYQKTTHFPNTILIAQQLEESEFLEDWLRNQANHRVELKVPQRGTKHQLLELGEKNARSFQKQQKARWEGFAPRDEEALEELAKLLDLPKPPKRMECYDNSHLSGTDTVASMVVFENGTPKNSDYRKFRLKTIAEGEIDDFKSMNEVLTRRLFYLAKAPKGVNFRKAAKIHVEGIKALLEEWRGDKTFTGELGEYTVALKNKRVIGLLRLQAGKEKTFLQKSLYVTPKARENGIAKGLMRYAFDRFKAKRVYLTCKQDMAEFYSRFGFDEVKQFPEEFSLELKEVLMAYDPSKHHDSSFESKPDLIVIDGGKGQLGMAVKARDALGLNIPMIGLAKREEDVFVPGKALPLIIPKDSKALLMLRHIRDEAHRFAITFQKDSRKKYLTASALDEVKGVGKGTKQKLLKHFGSVERIKAASLEEISTVVGQKVAENLLAQLK